MRKHRLGEPGDALDIGAIVHLAGEDDQRGDRLDPRELRGGVELHRVDTVLDRMDTLGPRPLAEQLCLGLAHEQAGIGSGRHGLFILGQHPRLAPHHPARETTRRLAIGRELGRIHVDKVHHHALAGFDGQILRHLA